MGYCPSRQLCHKLGTENNRSRTFGTYLQIKQLSNVWNNGCIPVGWSGSGSAIRDHLDHSKSNELMNPFQSGFIGSFDLPWSEWPRITDPDPDHLKGTHPICNVRALSKSQNLQAGPWPDWSVRKLNRLVPKHFVEKPCPSSSYLGFDWSGWISFDKKWNSYYDKNDLASSSDKWKAPLVFYPMTLFRLLHWFLVENALFCCLQHYIQIDLWDYDTLNRDDFMGRIQIPLAFLTEDTTACWYPLGRSSAKDNICGEVFLELTLKASQVWINILWVVMDTVTLKMILMLRRITITACQWTMSG